MFVRHYKIKLPFVIVIKNSNYNLFKSSKEMLKFKILNIRKYNGKYPSKMYHHYFIALNVICLNLFGLMI